MQRALPLRLRASRLITIITAKARTTHPEHTNLEEAMNRFNVSDARKEQLKRTAVGIVKEPRAIMAIGALILGIGLYSAIQTALLPILTVVGGGVGLAMGIGEFRKMNSNQSKMKSKHIYALIVFGAIFSTFGFFRMWNDIPVQTFIILFGALILGCGFIQHKVKRIASKAIRNL